MSEQCRICGAGADGESHDGSVHDARVADLPPICKRCGERVPSVHAHKYGLNGYACQPNPGTSQCVVPPLAQNERPS